MLPTQVQAGLRPPGGCGCGVSGHGWWLAARAAGWSRCPRSVCGPLLEGRLGSLQGLIKMSGRGGSRGSSVSHPTAPGTTGLPLPRDDPQTWQQHEDARPHPYTSPAASAVPAEVCNAGVSSAEAKSTCLKRRGQQGPRPTPPPVLHRAATSTPPPRSQA